MHTANVLVENDRTSVGFTVTAAECDDVREWSCYIKPLGSGMTVTAREAPEGNLVFRVHISGNDPAPSDRATASPRDEYDSRPAVPLHRARCV